MLVNPPTHPPLWLEIVKLLTEAVERAVSAGHYAALLVTAPPEAADPAPPPPPAPDGTADRPPPGRPSPRSP